MRSLVLKMLLIGAVGIAGPAQAAKMPTPKPPVGDEEFKFIKERDGISLYERWFEVKPGLKVRELKAQFTVDAGTVANINVIKDESRAPNWMQSLDVFELLENQGTTWKTYVRYNIPWPMDDQDLVLSYLQTNVEEGVLVAFQSDSDASHPVQNGVTRVEGVRGSWLFEPTGSKTRVTYKISTRNKSSLPRWITDPIVQDNLFDTMNSFCAQARELHAQR